MNSTFAVYADFLNKEGGEALNLSCLVAEIYFCSLLTDCLAAVSVMSGE